MRRHRVTCVLALVLRVAGAAGAQIPPAPPPSAEEVGQELLRRGLGELLGGASQEPSQPAQEQPQQ